ncbi:FAD-binding protein [Nocardioides sp. SYSU D00065]|uniref:FAD-dependent oxidoreductase n=1 Tax=Nocardioides sp. SYSU D00065 TaxID=2817378 RepID=UPI001B3308DE|nr:FAD-binding oxidoreductase [Nocardioides sp. SYSU D00065]
MSVLGVDPQRRTLTGWGRTAPSAADVAVPPGPDGVAALIASLRTGGDPPARGVLARGLGRSYGDAAQNAGGLVLDMTGCDRILSIDVDRGVVRVEAGVSIDTLTRTLLPLGLWLPVVPGTRQVTVGGAIAADVHGKNHHVSGSFGDHVLALDLVTADGALRTLTPDGPGAEAFWATVGGMGLTGVVVRATLSCVPAQTAYAVVRTERARDLDHLLELLAEDDPDPYSVAWFDALARGPRMGRAVLTRGRLARLDDLPARLAKRPTAFGGGGPGPGVPPMPYGLLNRATGRAFNELWFRKAPARPTTDVQPLGAFFQPLDGVRDWNRVYGPRGFCQYQFVVPPSETEAFRRAVALIADSGHPSCLNVLKRMGESSPGLLSFPAPGWTLAVDLPVGPGLDRLFHRLDDVVLGAGGRVYLAKDARLGPDAVEAMYPRLAEFRAARRVLDPEGLFVSDLARRVLL